LEVICQRLHRSLPEVYRHASSDCRSSNLACLLSSTMAYCVDPHLQKLIYSSVASVVSICGQFTTVLMATGTSKPVKAHWNADETTALLDYLLQHISEAGDGVSFKPSTWTAVGVHLAKAQLLTAGPVKTAKRCKSKWMSVCVTSVVSCLQ
jgi:hypothetical protein